MIKYGVFGAKALMPLAFSLAHRLFRWFGLRRRLNQA